MDVSNAKRKGLAKKEKRKKRQDSGEDVKVQHSSLPVPKKKKQKEEEERADEQHEENDVDEANQWRQRMSGMSFGQLRSLREQLGVRVFDSVYLNASSSSKPSKNSTTTDRDGNEDDSDEDEEEEDERTMKRENSKRPREVPTLRAPPKLFGGPARATRKGFDPRFDARCGEFNEEIHTTNYAFIEEMKDSELVELQNAYRLARAEGDGERAARIKVEIKRREDQQKTKREVERRREVIRDIRKENIERLKQGLRPKMHTRAHVKDQIQKRRMEELEKNPKQKEKYLARREKKASKRTIADIPH